MANTRRRYARPVEPVESEPLTSAALQIVPAPRGSNSFDFKREVDILLNGNLNQNTELAWYFYNRIPELRYIARYVANSLSQARLFVGEVTSDPYNPNREIGRAHVCTPVTVKPRMPSSA